jgi:hypothetical protein
LIIFDAETREITIIEKIKDVWVMVSSDVQMGDFGEKRHNFLRKSKKRQQITPEIIEEIRKRRQAGETIKVITADCGISPQSVFKYQK